MNTMSDLINKWKLNGDSVWIFDIMRVLKTCSEITNLSQSALESQNLCLSKSWFILLCTNKIFHMLKQSFLFPLVNKRIWVSAVNIMFIRTLCLLPSPNRMECCVDTGLLWVSISSFCIILFILLGEGDVSGTCICVCKS